MPKYFVKVNKGFRITIPKALRERLNIKVGDYVQVKMEKGGFIVSPTKQIPHEK
jgi:AbrB family looped-hinge helix DNA binding protein